MHLHHHTFHTTGFLAQIFGLLRIISEMVSKVISKIQIWPPAVSHQIPNQGGSLVIYIATSK